MKKYGKDILFCGLLCLGSYVIPLLMGWLVEAITGSSDIGGNVMSRMGVHAVEELLRGKSNLVVCERRGEIVSRDINYALKLDKMYKGTLAEGDLDGLSDETLAKMKSDIERKRANIKALYDVAGKINL